MKNETSFIIIVRVWSISTNIYYNLNLFKIAIFLVNKLDLVLK